MSLRGSLETFELADVLALVAGTAKTGELEVVSDRGTARLWFREGKIAGSELDDLFDPVAVVARLLRAEEGDFTFDTVAVDATADAADVPTVLTDADRVVAEWVEIESVIPSMHTIVTLALSTEDDEVTLTAREWAVVTAVGDGRSVVEVARQLELDDLAAARVAKGLVDRGLLEVAEAQARVVTLPAEEPDAALLVRQLASLTVEDEAVEAALAGPLVSSSAQQDDEVSELPEATPAAADATNRGALLKFLSSVRT